MMLIIYFVAIGSGSTGVELLTTRIQASSRIYEGGALCHKVIGKVCLTIPENKCYVVYCNHGYSLCDMLVTHKDVDARILGQVTIDISNFEHNRLKHPYIRLNRYA